MDKRVKNKSIGNICEDAYVSYGKYVNTNRALPYLYDGLKPSYRRVINTALEIGPKEVPTPDIVGTTIKVHPHGEKSIVDVITSLVRMGIFSEGGNFGYYPLYGEPCGAAAPRYTETGINKSWYDIFGKLLPYVPKVPGEKEGHMEPQYIPTVVPLALMFGTTGIGIGINTEIPSFSAKSMLEAYLADDPSLLKPFYDIEIDYAESDLEGLWRTGKGRVIYKYRYYKDTSEDGCNGVYIEGDTNIFYPDFSQINEWVSQGRVFIRDESSEGRNYLFIGRNPGVRAVTQQMIYDEVEKVCTSAYVKAAHKQYYRLGIHDGKVAKYISMRDWIDFTYKNYINLIETYKSTNIERCNFDIKVYTYLKAVAEILMNSEEDLSNQDIADKLGIEVEIVDAITRKSINTLKRVDTESKIANLQSSIDWYKSIDPQEYIKETINAL